MIGNRKHSKIDSLDPPLKDTVEQMLLAGVKYSDIVDFLKDNEIEISIASVCRYAKSLNANLHQLKIAQENFRVLMEEMEKYPQLDTTEAIIRLMSHNILDAMQNAEDGYWQSMDPEKMIANVNGLIRASAYKQQIDLKNKDILAQGFDAVKELVFSAMAKEAPELYTKVVEFLDKMKEA